MAETESPAPKALRLGSADVLAMALTFFALGVTLQVLLIDRGTSVGRALLASSVIFSATSQFAYLAVRDAGGGEWAAISAGAVVATRFGIMSMTLNPRLPHVRWRRVAAALNAFDPNVAVAVQQETPKDVEREFWRTTGAMMMGWFLGILVGTFIGNVVGDIDRLGLDAVFPAALLAIIGNLIRSGDGRIAAVAGGLICIVLLPVAPAGIPIILSVLGVAVAIILRRPEAVR